jgi:uncharacterized protein (TIGR03000 family)
MYSVVVAAMLTTASATPAWGCHGCYGGCYGCHGCWGGCYGGSCWGCHGCYGGCWGCHGCYGGCWGSCYGCYGCWGGCYGCYGCWGSSCYGCCGGGVAVMVQAPPSPQVITNEKQNNGETSALPVQATVVVRLPADADLYLDGQKSNLASATRRYVTPKLEPGQDYYYVIKARAVRQGEAVAQTKRVTLRAGQEARVDFGDLEAATAEDPAAAPAHITVRVPEDARSYVDGVVSPLTSRKRSFDTPALQQGRSYYYDLKAEVVREGKTRARSARVIVQAGKQVDVDFGDLSAVRTAQR